MKKNWGEIRPETWLVVLSNYQKQSWLSQRTENFSLFRVSKIGAPIVA